MDQSGEVPEPEQPAAQPASLPPPAVAPVPTDEPVPVNGRGFLIAGILAIVLVVGAVAWMARSDDGLDEVERVEGRFPTPTTLATPTTLVPPATSLVPAMSLVPPPTPVPSAPSSSAPLGSTAPGQPAPTTVVPDDPSYIATLVPDVAAFGELLSTPEQVDPQVGQMLASGRHDVAAPGPALTLCAAIRMDRPLAVRGRWERDGRRVAASGLERRDSPGFGECLTSDGDALADGSYQYIAADSNGHESGAGGIVIGAARVDQVFRNDGARDVCVVRIAPTSSRYFEVYVFDARPITPGGAISLPVAAVDQDAQAVGCDHQPLSSFSFLPSASVQSLAP